MDTSTSTLLRALGQERSCSVHSLWAAGARAAHPLPSSPLQMVRQLGGSHHEKRSFLTVGSRTRRGRRLLSASRLYSQSCGADAHYLLTRDRARSGINLRSPAQTRPPTRNALSSRPQRPIVIALGFVDASAAATSGELSRRPHSRRTRRCQQ